MGHRKAKFAIEQGRNVLKIDRSTGCFGTTERGGKVDVAVTSHDRPGSAQARTLAYWLGHEKVIST